MKLLIASLLLLWISGTATAVDEQKEPEADIPAVNEESVSGEVPQTHASVSVPAVPDIASHPAPVLVVRARIDAAFVAGDPSVQGFFLPSVRLGAQGDVAPYIRYRLAAGQVREFSSVMLPQLVPVEALIEIHSRPLEELERSAHFALRVGLFTPQFNPLWTPDLGDIPIPDYQETHRGLFLSRDTGAEVVYSTAGRQTEFSLGMFNGSGVVALNTNNAKAFTASVITRGELSSVTGYLGAAGYSFTQSSPGSLNFKSRVIGDFFVGVDWRDIGLSLQADAFFGKLEDSTRSVSPVGSGLTLFQTLWKGVRLYARAETSSAIISGATNVRCFQFGPTFFLHPRLNVYTLFSSTQDSLTSVRTFLVRFRLSI